MPGPDPDTGGENPPGALPILTLITLGAGGLLARFDDLCALTVGALYRNGTHRLPPRADCVYRKHTEKLPICNITQDMPCRPHALQERSIKSGDKSCAKQ